MKKNILVMLLPIIFYASSIPAEEYKIGQRITPDPTAKQKIDPQYPEISWSDLAPPEWDAVEKFKQFDFSKFSDDDPRAEIELEKMRAAFNEAPVQEKINGKKISIMGFLVPLDVADGNIKEFLLVPFFGACIHVPPPPANQLIHVLVDKPLQEVEAMAPVTVKGIINTVYIDTPMGGAAYRMAHAQVDPHVTKRCLFAPTCETEQ